jgi:hypothetical protein
MEIRFSNVELEKIRNNAFDLTLFVETALAL